MNKYYPEFGQELVSLLMQEFNTIQEQVETISPQAKIKNIRFLGELSKFGILSTTQALDCLKVCLDNFLGANIDLVSNFLETCGPFLTNQRDDTISRRINNLLDYMWRLKEKETISSMQTNNLESAYYMCRPEKSASQLHLQRNGGQGALTNALSLA